MSKYIKREEISVWEVKNVAYYPDDVINEVFAENDIVDYVSQYVRLKRSGKDYSGLCPFHREKSPSFHVSREKQLFHCFGCGASGNLVQFVMRSEGLDFVEAVRLLADRAGIILPEPGVRAGDGQLLKKKIYEMNRISARFFFDTLTKTPEGRDALLYFSERKIQKKTIIAYGLGFAPDSKTALHDHLAEMGYTDEEILKAGLCIERDNKITDKFRNRVMFPIIDLRGNVIGFGGRIMAKPENAAYKIPKYLNSAETPVFNKGRNLFSLNYAKKSSPYSIILVEGYMDVISVYQAGIHNVVATLGTALTENQAKLLMKYASEVLICYDSDGPGQEATVKAIEIMNSIGARSRVISLKDSKDPDEYIKKNGAAAFSKAVRDALPSTEFRLGVLRKKSSLDSPEGKAMFVAEAAEVLKSIKDAVEVDAYINRISKETEVSREAVYSEYKKRVAKAAQNEDRLLLFANNSSYSPPGKNDSQNSAPPKLMAAEKKLICLMTGNKKYISKVMEEFSAEDFSTDIHRRIVKIIYDEKKRDVLIEPSMILNEFSAEEAKYVSDVFYNLEEYSNNDDTLLELIRNIKIEKLAAQMAKQTDASEVSRLARQINDLRRNK